MHPAPGGEYRPAPGPPAPGPAGRRPRTWLAVAAVAGVLVVAAVIVVVVLTRDSGGSSRSADAGQTVRFTASTDIGAPTPDQLAAARTVIEDRAALRGLAGTEVVITGNEVAVTVPGDTTGDRARELAETARLYIRPVVDLAPAAPPDGTAGPTADGPGDTKRAVGEARATRQAAAGDLAARETGLRAEMAGLDCSPGAHDPLAGYDRPDEYLVTCGADDGTVYLLGPMLVDGRDVDTATATENDLVSVEFRGAGRDAWASFTEQNNGVTTAVVVDTRVVSAATINNPSGQRFYRTEISGGFTPEEARALAANLRSGALPVQLTPVA